jgi:Tfp pilus assembly protein PilN
MANRFYRNGWNLTVNLATSPRRNVRFYRLLAIILTIILLGVLCLLVFFNLKGFSEHKKATVINHELTSRRTALSSESRKESREVENLSRELKPQVDEINSLLERKAFSWVKFFSRLEEALPSGSYLASLSPFFSSRALEFRAKINLTGLDDLSQLVKNLNQQGFGELRVLSESFQDGKLQVEMNFKDVEVK